MKKFMKKSIALLMTGIMFVLPVSMSAQAKEVTNDTNQILTSSTNFVPNATITGNGINIRKTPSTSATVLGQLYKGDRIKAGTFFHFVGQDWYYCETKLGIKGYVAASYVKLD